MLQKCNVRHSLHRALFQHSTSTCRSMYMQSVEVCQQYTARIHTYTLFPFPNPTLHGVDHLVQSAYLHFFRSHLDCPATTKRDCPRGTVQSKALLQNASPGPMPRLLVTAASDDPHPSKSIHHRCVTTPGHWSHPTRRQLRPRHRDRVVGKEILRSPKSL